MGIAALLARDLYASLPLQPRQSYGFVLLAVVIVGVGLVSLVLMRRAVGMLLRQPDLLVPLALITLGEKLLGWLASLGGVFSRAFPLHLLNISFPISLHGLLGIALAVAYATWMTAVVLELVRTGSGDPCAVLPAAWRWFGRVLGVEFIGWAVVFLGIAFMMLLFRIMQIYALVPMAVGAVAWNFATAAVLPVGLTAGPGFWNAFRTGVRASFANLRKWWLLLLAQMLLLGLVMFFHTSWRNGGNYNENTACNVNAFWIGGYDNSCRWYDKLVEMYHTAKLPVVETLLALLLGTLAVAIKIALVQHLQPAPPPVLVPPKIGEV